MSEQAKSNVVEFGELKFPVIEYGITEAALAELAERYKDPDASTDEGYARCKDGCKEMTSLRTAVETRRKDLKAPALNWGSKVDKIAKALVRSIKLIESPVRDEKERVDEIKQAEARKVAQVEQTRVDSIKVNIEKIAITAREQNPDDTAADYQQHITWLTELAITDEIFGERVDDAKTERDAALFKLGQWHERAVQREADDLQRKADQEKLDKEREELEAAQEKQRQAEAKLEQEKREADEREIAATAEREKGEREAEQRKTDLEKAEQEKNEREERETAEKETARIGKIKGALNAKQTIPDHACGMTSNEIDRIIVAEKAAEPTEADFAEFLPEAITAWKESIRLLESLSKDTKECEEKTRRDDEARLPDRDKLLRWCDAIAEIHEPEVLNEKAQKTLRRYAGDLSKFLAQLRSDIGKL